MASFCTVEEKHDTGGHEYQVLAPNGADEWLDEVAKEYVALRTACRASVTSISIESLGQFSSPALLARLKNATIPRRRTDNFDVVRSDFGEVLLYSLLERQYGAKIGYKSVRDREITQSPGRGIDAIGIEDGQVLTLVLGEAKVSDDQSSPPAVVDKADDSLANQHRGHMNDLDSTANKLWDTARRVDDPALRDLYFIAALCLEHRKLDAVQIISCCTLVRSKKYCSVADFGSFRKNPKKFSPAKIRFLIVRLPTAIEDVVRKWYAIVQQSEVAA